jgi:hypothetical protein
MISLRANHRFHSWLPTSEVTSKRAIQGADIQDERVLA